MQLLQEDSNVRAKEDRRREAGARRAANKGAPSEAAGSQLTSSAGTLSEEVVRNEETSLEVDAIADSSDVAASDLGVADLLANPGIEAENEGLYDVEIELEDSDLRFAENMIDKPIKQEQFVAVRVLISILENRCTGNAWLTLAYGVTDLIM